MADTLVSTLYPPEIETFQPAFDCTKSANITFSLSAFNSIDDIKFIHVSIVDNRNNENVLPSYLAPQAQPYNLGLASGSMVYGISNGVLYMQMPDFSNITSGQLTLGFITYDADKDKYMVTIPPILLNYASINQTTINEEVITENEENPDNDSLVNIQNSTNSNYYWRNNRYYKVQIRFDSNPEVEAVSNADSPDNSSFSGNLQFIRTQESLNSLALINYMYTYREYFSEWSTVTLIKPIAPAIVQLNISDNDVEITSVYPGFFRVSGNIFFDYDSTQYPELTTEEEHLKEYRIQVYQKIDDTNTLGDLVFNSGIIYATPNYADNRYGINTLLDLNDTKPGDSLIVKVLLITNNNYSKTEQRLLDISAFTSKWFTEHDTYLWNINLNQEDGCATVNFNYTQQKESEDKDLPTGICYIYRSCSRDNFKTRDIIYKQQYTSLSDISGHIEITFEDYTLCSLYQYKYWVQYEDLVGNWSNRYESSIIYPKFYDMLLMRQNRQIAIRYNGQISSWKPTVNRQKVDTLGGKYPKFVENAVMNYKTFQISGLISAEEDYNRKFMTEFALYKEYDPEIDEEIPYLYQSDMKKYDDEFNTTYLIRNDTTADGENLYPNKNQIHHDTDMGAEIYEYENNGETIFSGQLFNQHDSYPHDHWYWERTFREELINWLNDGDPKLYRSMPEGNIAVILTDINLTPNTQLGRKLYDFSATLYEIGDGYSLDVLNNLGIINIPKIDSIYLDIDDSNFPIDDDTTPTGWKNGFGQYIKYAGATIGDIVNPNTSFSIANGRGLVNDIQNLWDNMTIYDRITQTFYTGARSTWCIKSLQGVGLINSIIQFTSTPHYFYYDNNGFHRITEIIKETDLTPESIYETAKKDTDPSWNNLTVAEQTLLMRRYVNIYFNESFQQLGTLWLGYLIYINEEPVFINEKGYYQIPKGTIVYHLQFDTDDTVTINYQYQYIEGTNTKGSSSIVTKMPNVLGQISDIFYPNSNTDIVDMAKRKYSYTNIKTGSIQYINNWKGADLDVTPYSVFNIYYTGNDIVQTIYVGRTGVLNLFNDTPIDKLLPLGRRMVVVDTTRQPYLDSWECILNITTNYDSTAAVINPQYNNIYNINNTYKIYYINGHWYNISGTIDNDTSVVIAEVPIEGMITYVVDVFNKRKV